MRATRAYVAGVGTAGSLLAGAAFLFVLASALVSFRGWPEIQGGASPAAVVLTTAHRSHHVAPSPRVLAALAPAAPAAAVHAGTFVAATGTPQRRASTAGAGKTAVTLTDPHATGTTPSTPANTGCTTDCGGSQPSGLAGGVSAAGSTLGTTVSDTGSTLGTTLTGVTKALGTVAGKVNSTLGQTVSQAGQAVGNLTTQTTASLGTVISGAGQKLGALLSGQRSH